MRPSSTRRRAGSAAVLLAAVLLAGCAGGSGDDNSTDAPAPSGTSNGPSSGPSSGDASRTTSDAAPLSDREQEYADAVVGPMQAQSDTPLADDDARCFSEGAVRVLGTDVLARGGTPAETGKLFTYYDLSSLDVDERTAEDVVAVLGDCGIDLRGAAITAARDDVSPAAADCIEAGVDAEAYRAMLVTQFHRGVEAFEDDVLAQEKDAGLDAGQQTWVTFSTCVMDHMTLG